MTRGKLSSLAKWFIQREYAVKYIII